MKKFQLSYNQTHELVKERRHKIDINTGFVEQLKEFERNNYTFKPDVTDVTDVSDVPDLYMCTN